jgi:cytoskeletal protein CcmA (bactofilin family)
VLHAGHPLAPESLKGVQSDSDSRASSVSTLHPPLDNGLGVPPFRPAPLKDAQTMSRPPFSPTPTPTSTPAASLRPGAPMGRPAPRDPSERRTLVVGRGISLQGIVQDAERLVVEGTVEATMIHATELAIAPGGVFKGEVEVEEAEIAGTIDGTLTARGSLIIRGSGKVLGTARCRRLQVEDGGQISGRIEMITDQPHSDLPPRQSVEPAI